MSNKFNRVLSDDWLPLEFKSGNDVPVTTLMVNLKTLKSVVEQTEQAVLAKLAEQEPVMYARTYYGEIDWGETCVTEENDGMLMHATDMRKEDFIRHGFAVIPLYAHPFAPPMNNKTFCVSEIVESDTQTGGQVKMKNLKETKMELNKLKDITTATLLRIVNEYGVDLTWGEEHNCYAIQHYPQTGMETLIEIHSQVTLVEVNGEGDVRPYRMNFRIVNGKLQGDLPKTLAIIEQFFPKETHEDIIEKVLEIKGLECTNDGIYKTVENYPRQGIQMEFIDMTAQYQIRVREVDESPLSYPFTYSIPTENVPNHKFAGGVRAQLEVIEFMFGDLDEE